MTADELKQLIEKDSFLDIAFERFQKFKQSDVYDEEYKFEVLSELNRYFAEITIDGNNIADIARKIQKSNPQSGSFVHWSNTADLVNYVEKNPEEAAGLLKSLYTENNRDLADRISNFREKGKAFNPEIKLGAPLFGYLLAAYDYEKFPLYKEDVFKSIKELLGIEKKLGSVSENYVFYYDICKAVQDHFANKGLQLTMLEVQDFFYCLTRYDELLLESAVAFIHAEAKKLQRFAENDAYFLETIKGLDQEFLKERREAYRNDGKVNRIRFLFLDQFLEKQQFDMDDFERIKSEVSSKFDTDILRNWSNFNILFHIYYQRIMEKVGVLLTSIHRAIRKLAEHKGIVYAEDKAVFDFNGARNLGGSRCWLAVYPKKIPTHKNAAQLFFAIDEKGIEYGLYYGSEHPKSGQSDLETVSDIEHFSFNRMAEKYKQVLPKFLADNVLETGIQGKAGELKDAPASPVALHPSLSSIFDTVEQAEWAFDFAQQALETLGISKPGDERVAVTFRNKRKIHIDFCNWLILGFYREKGEVMITVALIAEEVENKPYKKSFFTSRGEETPVALSEIPLEEFRTNSELLASFERTLPIIRERFVGYKRSPYRVYNVEALERAVFSKNERYLLFTEGVQAVPEQSEIIEIPAISFDREITFNGLYFEEKELIIRRVKTALQNGKHIILVGPPGTGKSKLAKEICRSFGADYKMATATSEWSTYETIGGYQPKSDGTLKFRPGIFLECFKDEETNVPINKWLIVDEMNRADIDKAFGALFSTLTGDTVTLNSQAESGHHVILRPQKDLEVVEVNDYEYIIPNDWRLIGTINTMDKASLYEMSYAFMRRFAFIPVGVPKKIDTNLVNKFLETWRIEEYPYSETLTYVWQQINLYRQIGPAIIEDIARYTVLDGDITSAIILYVLPQFEGLMDHEIRGFIERLEPIEEIDTGQLTAFAEDFFYMKG